MNHLQTYARYHERKQRPILAREEKQRKDEEKRAAKAQKEANKAAIKAAKQVAREEEKKKRLERKEESDKKRFDKITSKREELKASDIKFCATYESDRSEPFDANDCRCEQCGVLYSVWEQWDLKGSEWSGCDDCDDIWYCPNCTSCLIDHEKKN